MASCRKKEICTVFSYSPLLHLANWKTILSLCEGGYFSEREDVMLNYLVLKVRKVIFE